MEDLFSSDSERQTTSIIDVGPGTTSDSESEMESSDDVLINENVEDHPDNSPDDEPVDTSSEQTSTFDSEHFNTACESALADAVGSWVNIVLTSRMGHGIYPSH